MGESVFLRLRRIGSRVFLEAPNMRFRALSDNAAEVRATQESFATSILWAQDIAALDKKGTSLVDFTSFLVRDAHKVSRTLQGNATRQFSSRHCPQSRGLPQLPGLPRQC